MIENCNLVNQSETKVKLNSSSKKVVRVFFSLDQKLIILGQADNKYAYFFSYSDISDEQTNQKLLIEAFESETDVVSSIDELAKLVNLSYEDLLYLYSEEVKEEINLLERYQQVKKLAEAIDVETERKLYDYLIRSFNRNDDPKKDFASFSLIIQKVRDLKYLLLCDNETVRLTYIELKKSCSEIIERYKKSLK